MRPTQTLPPFEVHTLSRPTESKIALGISVLLDFAAFDGNVSASVDIDLITFDSNIPIFFQNHLSLPCFEGDFILGDELNLLSLEHVLLFNFFSVLTLHIFHQILTNLNGPIFLYRFI